MTQDREHIKKAAMQSVPKPVPDSRHSDRQGDGRILRKSHQNPTTDAPSRGEMTQLQTPSQSAVPG